jgi:hypothetical protein
VTFGPESWMGWRPVLFSAGKKEKRGGRRERWAAGSVGPLEVRAAAELGREEEGGPGWKG